MRSPLIRTFSYQCHQKYGQGVGKIVVDLGLPCPNRARGGCIFCRPASFAPAYLKNTDSVARQVALADKRAVQEADFRARDKALIKLAELRRKGPAYLGEWARNRIEWERARRRGETGEAAAPGSDKRWSESPRP